MFKIQKIIIFSLFLGSIYASFSYAMDRNEPLKLRFFQHRALQPGIHESEILNNDVRTKEDERYPHFSFFDLPLDINPATVKDFVAKLNQNYDLAFRGTKAQVEIVKGRELNRILGEQALANESGAPMHSFTPEESILVVKLSNEFSNTTYRITMPMDPDSPDFNEQTIKGQLVRRFAGITERAEKFTAAIHHNLDRTTIPMGDNFKNSLLGQISLKSLRRICYSFCSTVADEITEDVSRGLIQLMHAQKIQRIKAAFHTSKESMDKRMEDIKCTTAVLQYSNFLKKLDKEMQKTTDDKYASALKEKQQEIEKKYCNSFEKYIKTQR